MPPLTETQRYQIEHDIRLGMISARTANELNQRPRKRLGWPRPAKLLSNLTTAPPC
jgi:hypothetical protein